MKRLKMRWCLFITRSQTAVVTQPCQTAFHDVTRFAQATAMFAASWGDQRCHQETHDPHEYCRETIAPIALHNFGPARFAVTPDDFWQTFERCLYRLIVPLVGWPGMNCQRKTVGVHNYMAFAAGLASIGGVGSGMDPPKSARTEALSTTARDQLMRLAFSKSCSRICCSLAQMPSFVQSRSRRQQVVGEGNSIGIRCHAMPP